MTKLKKTMAVLMCVLTLLSICLVAAGCPQKEPERPIVDIKVVCFKYEQGQYRIIEEWDFVDTAVLHTEREYDGTRYYYTINAFRVRPSSEQDKTGIYDWVTFTYNHYRDTFISQLYSYDLSTVPFRSELCFNGICDKGHYELHIRTCNGVWANRYATLKIDII